MNIRSLFVAATLVLASMLAAASDRLIAVKSPHDAQATMSQLENIVKQRKLKVFARIDHAAGAASVGMTLRPTDLLIFGNPKGGRPSWSVRRPWESICRSRRWCGRTPRRRSGLAITIPHGWQAL